MKHARTFSLLCALATTAALAHAGDPPAVPAVDEATNARADELTRKGTEMSKKRRWAEAEALFREAWGLKHSYDIGGNLGVAELSLGKYRDAAEHLTFGLKTFPANGKPEHRDLVRESLARARAEVGALGVEVSPRGAEIFVDGKSVGTAPLGDEVFVEPGTRTVEAKATGYVGAKQSVEVGKGATLKVSLKLDQVAPRPPPPVATGSASAGTPPPPPLVERGANRGVLIAGGAAAGVGIVMGSVFAVLSSGKANDAEQKVKELASKGGPSACVAGTFVSECDTIHKARQDRDTLANLSAWSFIGAGTLGAGTVIYALTAPKSPRAGAVRVAPVVTAHQGGVTIFGAW